MFCKTSHKNNKLDQLRKNFLKLLKSSQSDSNENFYHWLTLLSYYKKKKKSYVRVAKSRLSKIIFMILAGYSPKQYLWFLFKKKKAILAIYSAPMIKTPTSKLENPAKWQMTKHTINYWCKQVCIQAKWLTRLELIPVLVSWGD